MVDFLRRDARPLMGLEVAALVGAAPFLLFPTYRPGLGAVTLALLALAWLLRWIIRGEAWPVTPFNGALLVLALMIPVGVWASAFPEVTLPKLSGLILGLAAFRGAAFFVRDRRTLVWALAGLALLGLAIVAGGALGVGWPNKIALLQPLVRRLPKAAGALGTDINPNQLGGVMALYVPLAAACAFGWLAERRWVAALLSLAGLGVAAGTLALTQSRGALVGAAAGLALLAALWALRHPQRGVRYSAIVLTIVLAIALAGGLVAYVGPERLRSLVDGSTAGDSLQTAAGQVSLAGRLEIWSRAVYALQDFPFTGCGLGTFRRVVHLLYPLFLVSPDRDIAHAHNIFLQTGLDLGLPGLVAYLGILWVTALLGWQAAARPRPADGVDGETVKRRTLERWIVLGIVCGVAGLHVYGMADAIALGAKPGLAFWSALGVGVGGWGKVERRM